MDLKQLQYFVACAQTGSFSDAAKILYSTQPSVSKVIKSLEDTLGMQLFERLPRGIRLTVQGQKVYHYACRITNEIDVLENMASRGMTKWIRISMNPSSWFANQFVDFYNETFEKNYHFQLTTAGVRSVMERVRDYMDDIGFVYILSTMSHSADFAEFHNCSIPALKNRLLHNYKISINPQISLAKDKKAHNPTGGLCAILNSNALCIYWNKSHLTFWKSAL